MGIVLRIRAIGSICNKPHFVARRTMRNLILLLIFKTMFIPPGSLQAQNTELIIQTGTTLTVSGGNLLLNTTDLTCNGTLNASSGTVLLTGAASTAFSGAGVPQFGTLTLNTSSASTLTLNANFQVSQALKFQNGIINLNGQQIQLTGSGALQGESETSYTTGLTGGSVMATAAAVSNPSLLDIGNLGAALTTTTNLGTLTVTRTNEAATNPAMPTQHGIQRTYLIQPQNNTALDATLRFYYLDEELNGEDPTTLSLWKSTDGVNWTQIGASTRDGTNKYVEQTGLTDLSYWTLSDMANALPLTLLTFGATCEDQYALLHWQTGSEISVNYFEVQKSLDGNTWTDQQKVAAMDDPSGASYSYKDPSPSASAYYRLKIVDLSGVETYSPVFRGGCGDITLPLTVYPSPVISQATARVSVRQAGTGTILLFDMNGRQVYEDTWQMVSGINQLLLPVSGLTAGTYVVKLVLSSGTQQTTFIKR